MAFRTLSTLLLRLTPLHRRLLLIAADALFIPLAVWLSFRLRLAHPFSAIFLQSLWMLPAALLIGLPLYALTGQYKGHTRMWAAWPSIALPAAMACLCWCSPSLA